MIDQPRDHGATGVVLAAVNATARKATGTVVDVDLQIEARRE